MKKNIFLILITAIPLALIFLAFFNPAYGNLVRKSIIIFPVFAVPYCLLVKDPRKGLLLFLIEASLFAGPWKNFTYGTNLKLLVYIIRDLLLYASFLNFLMHKKRILPENILRQKPPYTGLIFIFLLNVIIQTFNPDSFNYLSAIAGGRMFWEMIPLYWMGFYFMRDKNHFKVLCWAIILCLFFNSIATILQYNWGKERVALISEGYHAMTYKWGRELGEKLRAPGLGSDMGFAGNYFSQAVAIFIALFITIGMKLKQKRRLILILLIALTIIGLAGLIASASRTAMVISVIYLIIIFLLQKALARRRLIRIIVLFALLLIAVIPYMLRTFEVAAQRYESVKTPAALLHTITEVEKGRVWQAFVLPFIYSTKFFLGNGLGKVGPGAGLFSSGLVAPTNTENTLNLSVTEIGTIGTVLWIVFHIFIVRRGLVIYKHINDPEWKWYSMIPLSYMLLSLFFWQFGQLISFPQNAGFWFMSGNLMGLKYIED